MKTEAPARKRPPTIKDRVRLATELPEEKIEALDKLARDKAVAVRTALAVRKIPLPDEIQEILSNDAEFGVVCALAIRDDPLPERISSALQAHPNAKVRNHLATREDLSVELVEKLANDPDSDVRTKAAAKPNIAADTLRRLAADAALTPRLAAARSQRLPEDAIRSLASDSDVLVRIHVATRAKLPIDVIERLIEDDDARVRQTLVRRSELPSAILAKALRDPFQTVVEAALLYSPNLAEFRTAALSLAGGETTSRTVRLRLAKCPGLDERVVRALNEALDRIERNGGFANATRLVMIRSQPAIPEDIMRSFARSNDATLLNALVDRKTTSPETLLVLSLRRLRTEAIERAKRRFSTFSGHERLRAIDEIIGDDRAGKRKLRRAFGEQET
jgi:hypothetical protein